MTSVLEKRSEVRIECDMPAHVHGTGTSVHGIVVDVSPGGVAVRADASWPPSTVVFIRCMEATLTGVVVSNTAGVLHIRRTD